VVHRGRPHGLDLELLPGDPQNKQIAHSFSDFLERALRSGGRLYWLKNGWALLPAPPN
jgi:hypothetical protein